MMDNMTAGQELLRQKEERLKVMENALLGGLVSKFNHLFWKLGGKISSYEILSTRRSCLQRALHGTRFTGLNFCLSGLVGKLKVLGFANFSLSYEGRFMFRKSRKVNLLYRESLPVTLMQY